MSAWKAAFREVAERLIERLPVSSRGESAPVSVATAQRLAGVW